MTYLHKSSGAEAGASVEPVIVAQLVDLDAFLVRRMMRHGLCHHQWFGAPLGAETGVAEDIGGEVEVLLKGQLSVGLAKDGERHFPVGRSRLEWGAARSSREIGRARDSR